MAKAKEANDFDGREAFDSLRTLQDELMTEFAKLILFIRWTDLLGSYTRLQLSQASDRLPAISGIAPHIQK